MKKILGTVLLVTLLSLTIFALNQTEQPDGKEPVSSVSSAKITE